MTMTRLWNHDEDTLQFLTDVESAIERDEGTQVQFKEVKDDFGKSHFFEGYTLVGFGR